MADEFDNECPHCGADINVEEEWMYGDHSSNLFTFDCPQCGEEIAAEVEFDPVFYVSKPTKS